MLNKVNTPLLEYYLPQKLSANRLDRYLASGWFRSGNALFRNKIIILNNEVCTVINARLKLTDYTLTQSHKKIYKKCQSFRTEIGDLVIDEAVERLYDATRYRFKGFVMPSLKTFLFERGNRGIFNSKQVRVYAGDKLIAASVFDPGEKGIMSVVGLYDRGYPAHSLGFYTLLLEIHWAIEQGYEFYYPGYVIHESAEFDYKKRIGKLQYQNNNFRWTRNYDQIVSESVLKIIVDKNKQLEDALNENGLPYERMVYRYFPMGYAHFEGDFLCYPILFLLPNLNSSDQEEQCIAAYNPKTRLFDLSSTAFHIDETLMRFTPNNEGYHFTNKDYIFRHLRGRGHLNFAQENPVFFGKMVGMAYARLVKNSSAMKGI